MDFSLFLSIIAHIYSFISKCIVFPQSLKHNRVYINVLFDGICRIRLVHMQKENQNRFINWWRENWDALDNQFLPHLYCFYCVVFGAVGRREITHCSFEVINSLKCIVATPYTSKRNKNTPKWSKCTLTPLLQKNHILLTPKMTAIRLRGRGKWPTLLLSDWPCRSELRLWVLLLLWQSFEINWSPLWPERESR